jgi:predicted Zn-dependent peptidase
MEKMYYPGWNETVYFDRLPNGLPIYVVPRPGFTKKLCYFVTDYGAIHTAYTLNGEALRAPDGVAHFLEHKMFDLPGRDVTAEFAALGARPNAFTSYDLTAYYFSCTENFHKNLRLLLEFVSTPYFTEESVAKEQGIIGQEIGMSTDNPDSQSFELLMKAMYKNHPIHTPILGSRDSIAQITAETLYDCHKAFYRPDNMLLCVVGDVDPEAVKQAALDILPPKDTAVITRQERWEEDMTPVKPFVTAKMEVAMPMFQLGFKAAPLDKGEEAVHMEAVGDLAAEALFGESSPLYQKLYEEGIIDGSFGGGFETVDGMALLLASGDSDYPEKVKEAILAQAQTLLAEGLEEKDFLRMKRSALGRRIRDLDSFDSLCFRICAYHFSGYDYFRFPEVYKTVTARDILDFIKEVVTPERACLCVIEPTEQEA